jgi:hypothetical protein
MITQDTREAPAGMATTRYITANMHRIMRIMTGVITEIITRIIIGHSRHAERALRRSSTVTITMTMNGGTSGNWKSRVRDYGKRKCSLARVSPP